MWMLSDFFYETNLQERCIFTWIVARTLDLRLKAFFFFFLTRLKTSFWSEAARQWQRCGWEALEVKGNNRLPLISCTAGRWGGGGKAKQQCVWLTPKTKEDTCSFGYQKHRYQTDGASFIWNPSIWFYSSAKTRETLENHKQVQAAQGRQRFFLFLSFSKKCTGRPSSSSRTRRPTHDSSTTHNIQPHCTRKPEPFNCTTRT